METKAKIQTAYIDYILSHKTVPNSIYAFTKSLDLEEKDFYEHFNSFKAVERSIWVNLLEKSVEQTKTEAEAEDYDVRQKFLSLYYNLIEALKEKRSFVRYTFECFRLDRQGSYKRAYAKIMKPYIEELITAGFEADLLQNRTFIDKYYDKLFERQVYDIIRFWCYDNSAKFENTDAFIEKSLQLVFSLVTENLVDYLFNFVKFSLQKKKWSR